mmetsp:Transcript_7833/g.19416  ORF Transcript_7833/g.19416 Transcript_7833/m.19416 type:complete len:240 (+) Transcript_7833:1255-1974(+)
MHGSQRYAAPRRRLGEGTEREVGHHPVDPLLRQVHHDVVLLGNGVHDLRQTILLFVDVVVLSAKIPFLLVVPERIRGEPHLRRVAGVRTRRVVRIAVRFDRESLHPVGSWFDAGYQYRIHAEVVAYVLAGVEVRHELCHEGRFREFGGHFGKHDCRRLPLLHVLASERDRSPQRCHEHRQSLGIVDVTLRLLRLWRRWLLWSCCCASTTLLLLPHPRGSSSSLLSSLQQIVDSSSTERR